MSPSRARRPARSAGASVSDDRSVAERVATAVLAVEDVVALSAGPVGQFRTYLSGGSSVPGVRLDDERLDLNIVTRYGPELPALSERVAAAVRPHLAAQTIAINVDDIVLPGDPDPDRADSVVEHPPAPGAGSQD